MKFIIAIAAAIAVTGCTTYVVPLYDECDVWSDMDRTRLSNFIMTPSFRSEEEHLQGLDFFREKYGTLSFNMCYDSLVNPNG